MANTSGFGAGFDDFLMAQEGTANPTQNQQSASTAAVGTGAAIPGFEANPNPPSTAANSGIDQGFLDFLSGQESKTGANQTPQTSPEVIPAVAPTQAAPETIEAIPEPTVVAPTPQTTTTSPAANEQTAQTTSSPETASPEGEQQQAVSEATTPSDPQTIEALKEIKEKFGGRWKLVRSDPYDEYLKSTGIGLINRQLAARGFPEQVFTVEGDKICIGIHSTFHNQNYTFKLNEETQNLVQKEPQSVFCSYKDGKLTLQMTPVNQGFAKVQEVERALNERGELVVVYVFGGNTCRRYYERVMTVVG